MLLAATNRANTIDNPGKLTVYRTDGATVHVQIPVAADAGAQPIDGIG